MPLLLPTLVDELRKIIDNEFSGFEGFPTNDVQTADRWAAAFGTYMVGITNPPPGAGTIAGHSAGRSAMAAALAGMSVPGLAIVLLPLGFAAYAAAFAGTTAPFVSGPPPAPLVMPPLPPASGLVAATALAAVIDAWTRTGLTGLPPASPAPGWA
jgi:hypothetical protein